MIAYHTRTLFYYDGPQIFEAQDDAGNTYIGVSVDSTNPDKFIIKPVKLKHLHLFYDEKLDLRELLTSIDPSSWYLGSFSRTGKDKIILSKVHPPPIDDTFLPEKGFFLEANLCGALPQLHGTHPSRPTRNYYILNTNRGNNELDSRWMISKGVAAAFHHPWKLLINKILADDVVFLYENGIGIVGYGHGTGKTEITDYYGTKNETHFQVLKNFRKLKTPLSAWEIRTLLGYNLPFLKTMVRVIDGDKILRALE